jgi:hypothetical protein
MGRKERGTFGGLLCPRIVFIGLTYEASFYQVIERVRGKMDLYLHDLLDVKR